MFLVFHLSKPSFHSQNFSCSAKHKKLLSTLRIVRKVEKKYEFSIENEMKIYINTNKS